MDKRLLTLAIAVVVAIGAGFLLSRRAAEPSADAAKIMDAAERLAVFPGLTDAAAISSAFGVTFGPPGDGSRQTLCAGHPLQASRSWQSSASGNW